MIFLEKEYFDKLTWWTCPSISTETIKSALGTGRNTECTSVSSRSITKHIFPRSLSRNAGNKAFSFA